MDTNRQMLISIRTKKLGLLIKNARSYRQKSAEECAAVLGLPLERYYAYESGAQAPSLPEIETLAYFLDVPLDHFWGASLLAVPENQPKSTDLARLSALRNRIIGTRLRIARQTAGMDVQSLAEKLSIAVEHLNQIETGQAAISLPQLEICCKYLNLDVMELIDQKGPIGAWRKNQLGSQKFASLSPELQDFVSKPVNHPYINLAVRLSELSVEKLRAVAEGLLEITY